MIPRRRRPDVSAFAGVTLFARFHPRDLAPLARHVDRVAVTPGTTLAREGDLAHEVVVVAAGEVVVSRGGVELDRCGPGTVIGAAEDLAGARHGVTYVAATGLSALVLTGPAFRWAVQSLAGLADALPVAMRGQPAGLSGGAGTAAA